MADPLFFTKTNQYSLKDLAERSLCRLHDDADPDFIVSDVSPLDGAEKSQISFLDNKKYKESFKSTKAGACIVSEEMADLAPDGVNLLISQAPYLSYAKAAQVFYPENFPDPTISPLAYVDPGAQLESGCIVEPGAVVKAGAEIGEGTWIESGAIISNNVRIGKNCRVGANATVSHAFIGNNVRLYPGVRVGQDGFGFAIHPSGFVKVPQLGRVIIEDNVEVGANTTIDRGAGPDTIIGAGTWIDNLVQIGHNVRLGKCCVIVSQVGISGSTELGDFVMVGGQSGIAGHLRIGTGAKIGAQSGVMRNIDAGDEQMGSPAVPSKQFMRQTAHLSKLVKGHKKN